MPEPRNLRLFAWAADLRRARLARRRLRRRIAITAVVIVPLGLTIAFPPAPWLLWNASASAPIGLYHVTPGAAVKAGDMVVAHAPMAVRELAARRHYLPAHVPLVKRVAAMPRSMPRPTGSMSQSVN